MNGKIVKRGDSIFVEVVYRQSGHPRDTVLLWKSERVVRDPYRPGFPEDGDAVRDGGIAGGWANYHGEGWTVQFGSNCQAESATERDVPCPKVRKGIETRWHNGEWQKMLKGGWVRA